jgi:alanine racemase
MPVGYYEGLDRRLSNQSQVLIRGEKAPIIGRISMHMTILDLTDIKAANLEDEIVILGKQQDQEITLPEIVSRIEIIPHEFLIRIPESISRIYVD